MGRFLFLPAFKLPQVHFEELGYTIIDKNNFYTQWQEYTQYESSSFLSRRTRIRSRISLFYSNTRFPLWPSSGNWPGERGRRLLYVHNVVKPIAYLLPQGNVKTYAKLEESDVESSYYECSSYSPPSTFTQLTMSAKKSPHLAEDTHEVKNVFPNPSYQRHDGQGAEHRF